MTDVVWVALRSLLAPVLASTLVLSGCASYGELDRHEWFRPAPKSALAGLARLPAAEVFPVTAVNIVEASRQLSAVAATRISPVEASRFVGQNLNADDNYVLLRGLCAGCGTGAFYVYANDHLIVVDNLSLASRTAQPQRWPVVVKRMSLPRDVYVQYSIAE